MRSNIAELTEDQVIVSNDTKFFRPVFAQTPPIPAAYDGKYACMIVVAANVALSEVQMDQLETAIEGISGIAKAYVLIGPARIPIDRTPAGCDLKIGCEASFRIDPTSEEV